MSGEFCNAEKWKVEGKWRRKKWKEREEKDH